VNSNAKWAVYAICATAVVITVLILSYLANPGTFK
jgi:hypothetical protein